MHPRRRDPAIPAPSTCRCTSGSIVIRRYKHLGDDIGVKEARRFRQELKAAIEAIAAERRIDSPICTFLPNLRPPLGQQAVDEEALAPFAPLPVAAPEHLPPAANLLVKAGGADTEAVDLNTKQLLERAQKKINDSDFVSARVLLEEARKHRPTDSIVIQRLALAVYKSKQPHPAALKDALEVLHVLKPETCNNPEALGLYGAIHKVAVGDQPLARTAGHRHHRLCARLRAEAGPPTPASTSPFCWTCVRASTSRPANTTTPSPTARWRCACARTWHRSHVRIWSICPTAPATSSATGCWRRVGSRAGHRRHGGDGARRARPADIFHRRSLGNRGPHPT